MKRCMLWFAIFFFAFGLVWANPAYADDLYASVRGTISDQSGALISDAHLSATNLARGLSYSGVVAKDGYFTFFQLAIGDYTVLDPTAYGFTGITPQTRSLQSLPLMISRDFSRSDSIAHNPTSGTRITWWTTSARFGATTTSKRA